MDYYNDPRIKGEYGEILALSSCLKKLIEHKEWFMAFYNVKLPSQSIKDDTQIDAIILTNRGVFVIEIKTIIDSYVL